MQHTIRILALLAFYLLTTAVGCSNGRRDVEPTPNEANPPQVEDIDPASLRP